VLLSVGDASIAGPAFAPAGFVRGRPFVTVAAE
jgi:hypothetical protein